MDKIMMLQTSPQQVLYRLSNGEKLHSTRAIWSYEARFQNGDLVPGRLMESLVNQGKVRRDANGQYYPL